MTRKSFLAELKVLLHANLEPAEAKDAYSYYCELVDEEPECGLIRRLGSPQSALEELLSQKERSGHTLRGGISALFLSFKVPHYRVKAALTLLALLLALLIQAAALILVLWDFLAVITFRYVWMLWLIRDLTLMSGIILLMMVSMRHIPYIMFTRRKSDEETA